MATSTDQIERLIEFANRQLARLDKHLEAVQQDGDVDAVHDFRVASRRLQEPLATMAHWTSRRTSVQVHRRLRRLRQALRQVRDLDVLFESLSDAETAPRLDPVDRECLEQWLIARRRRKLAEARSELLARKPHRIQTQVPELIAAFRVRTAQDPAAVVETVGRQWQQRADAVLAAQPGDNAATDLHACRILLKKLRYSTELLRRMEERKRGDLLDALERMQDHLGAWNDHLFAVTELARCAARRQVLVRTARFTSRLLGCAADRALQADALRRAALAAWPEFHRVLEQEYARRARAVSV